MIDVRNRGIQILLAVVLLIGLFVGGMAYRANYTCSGLRDGLRDAQAQRADGEVTDEDLADVGDAARRARARGCDVDDLVDPSVGQ